MRPYVRALPFVLAPLLAVLLPGCIVSNLEPSDVPLLSVRTHLRVHGDDRFTQDERRSIERASLAWSRFTNGRTRVEIYWDVTERNYVNVPLPMIYRSDRSEFTGNFGGNTKDGIVRLVPETCDMYASLETCAKHEFGHLFGLHHFDDIQGQVMSTCPKPPVPGCGPSGVFGPADNSECVRVGVCDRSGMSDVTTVTVTVDPIVPRVEADYP